MDDNTKEVLILLITTCSTIGIAWIRMRGMGARSSAPVAPASADPPETGPTTGV